MGSIAGIITLLTTLAPSITNVIMMIKDKTTGKLDVFVILDSVDAQVAANQKQITDYLASHQ